MPATRCGCGRGGERAVPERDRRRAKGQAPTAHESRTDKGETGGEPAPHVWGGREEPRCFDVEGGRPSPRKDTHTHTHQPDANRTRTREERAQRRNTQHACGEAKRLKREPLNVETRANHEALTTWEGGVEQSLSTSQRATHTRCMFCRLNELVPHKYRSTANAS